MEERRYLISDAAKLVAVEAHVLRYWEDELSLSIGRTELGHRYYTREDIEIFQKVKRLKEEGLQLRAIRVVLQNTGRAGMPRGSADEMKRAAEASQQQDAGNGAYARERTGAVEGGAAEASPLQDAENGTYARERTDAVEGDAAQTALATLRTNAEKLEQFTELVQSIVEKVVRDNNEELQRRLEESMARETSYLLHMQEQQAEEHFRQLDEAIRARQKNGSFVAAAKEKKHFWSRLRR